MNNACFKRLIGKIQSNNDFIKTNELLHWKACCPEKIIGLVDKSFAEAFESNIAVLLACLYLFQSYTSLHQTLLNKTFPDIFVSSCIRPSSAAILCEIDMMAYNIYQRVITWTTLLNSSW